MIIVALNLTHKNSWIDTACAVRQVIIVFGDKKIDRKASEWLIYFVSGFKNSCIIIMMYVEENFCDSWIRLAT